MARDFRIEGPVMVFVTGGKHMSGRPISYPSELGLSADSVRVEPRWRHRDISCDDFGGDIPAEAQFMMSDALIKMTLVHFDYQILDICESESMGGGSINYGVTMEAGNSNPVFGPDLILNARGGLAGRMAPAGMLMGAGLPLFASGNHYISLTVNSPVLGLPWRFRSCYLSERPLIHPVGTKYSQVELTWRAIPYAPIFVSGLVSTVYTTTSLPYNRPPAMTTSMSLDLPDLVGEEEDEEEFDPDDPQQYFLTREILSSGLTLWDRSTAG